MLSTGVGPHGSGLAFCRVKRFWSWVPALMFRMGIILIYGMTRGCLCKGAFMCPPLLLLTAQLQKLWTFLMSSILNVVDCKVIEKIHFNCCPGKDKWVWQIGEVQCQFSLQRSVETRFDFTPPPPPHPLLHFCRLLYYGKWYGGFPFSPNSVIFCGKCALMP